MATAEDTASGLVPDDPAFDVSRADDVAALHDAEDRHFWHLLRNRIIEGRLRSLGLRPGMRILDLGCGSGCVAAHLGRRGYEVTGVDGHESLLETARSRAPHQLWLCRDLARGTRDLFPRTTPPFDAVALFDVLEHLDDPASALVDALAWTKPGGVVVGTVPALMLLWSSIDERSGHKLRYSRKTLAALLERVKGRGQGARLAQLAPFNRTLVPWMWAQRHTVARGGGAADSIRNLAVPWWPVNRAFYGMVMLEHRLAPFLDRTPVEGASLWFAMRNGGETETRAEP